MGKVNAVYLILLQKHPIKNTNKYETYDKKTVSEVHSI